MSSEKRIADAEERQGRTGCPRPKSGSPAAIYVHVPFCRHVCDYCDYPTIALGRERTTDYVEAVCREFDGRSASLDGRHVVSMYFGGGTPSVLPPEAIHRLVDRMVGGRRAEVELTLESNPEDIDPERLSGWVDAGIDRLIVGVQSLDDGVLERLGRTHTSDEARRAVGLATDWEGLSVGVDLVFGAPGQSVDGFRGDVVAMGRGEEVDAIFGFEFTDAEGAGRDPDGDFLTALCRESEQIGLQRDAVASFTRPGHASRHNRVYYTGEEYLGLGCAARSMQFDEKSGVLRRFNSPNIDDYMSDPVDSGRRQRVTPFEHLEERLMLSVHVRQGLDLGALRRQFAACRPTDRWERRMEAAEEALMAAVGRGLLQRRGQRFEPTDAGLSSADGLGLELAAQLGA